MLVQSVRQILLTTLLGAPALVLAQAGNTGDDNTLEEMVVTGTALKVEVPLVETPRPAAVVEREELDERNVQSLDETFRYRAGVRSGQYGGDNDTDWLQIRGFDQSTYQDGLRLYRDGFYQWLPEPFGLEKVELLKGPASILYGEAPPGGLINAISKRPTATPQGTVEIQAGSDDHRQIGIDTSGPVSGRDDLRYRLVGLYRSGDGDIDYTENERYYFAPSLEWVISDQTRLTVLASVQKDDAIPYNGFKLPYGTLQDTAFGRVSRSTNYSEPDYDTNERTQSSLGYSLSHAFNDTWRFEQDLRYSELDLLLRSSYILGQSPTDPREGTRGLTYRDGDISSWTVDNRLVGKWFTDRTENTLLLGLDYQDLENEGEEANLFSFGDGPIDLFDPEYGNFTPVSPADLTRRQISKEQTGLYVQNQLRLDDRWIFLGGVRYDNADSTNTTGAAADIQRADEEQISLSGGIMYRADNGLSPYLSYTESVELALGIDPSTGEPYRPVTGEQTELGVKYTPDFLDGYINAAVYHIEENNSLVTSAEFLEQVQEGKSTTDGFELEAVAYLTDQWQATAAYTYNDATSENRASNQGEQRSPLIPRHMASLWMDYSFLDWAPGLTIGGGARFVGETEDEAFDLQVPSYTVFDVMARYDLSRHWRAQLNVNNVADRKYVASCDFWCYYGESRSVVGSLSYRW